MFDFTQSLQARDTFVEAIKSGEKRLFSFVSEGATYTSDMFSCREEALESGGFKLIWTLGETGLELCATFKVFQDFPYAEYECHLRNPGTTASAVIESLHTLDIGDVLERAYYGHLYYAPPTLLNDLGTRVKVTYYLGSYCQASDFMRVERRLHFRPGEDKLHLGVVGGGRSSEACLPFFNVHFDDKNGMDIGVGWSGNWFAEIGLKRTTEKGWSPKRPVAWTVAAGMPETHFRLEPGEEVRSPGYFIGFRRGISEQDFINVHRRFMLEHHAPRDSKGNQLVPPLALTGWGGVRCEDMKKILDTAYTHDLPFEVHWIDAGWQGADRPCPHPCDLTATTPSDWFKHVGTYRINGYAHPNGLREITDFARERNMQTLVWFEVERLHKECGSPLFTEHPDWLLDNGGDSYMLNLGIPEARQYVTDVIIDFMKREGIEHYRQDFNINPMDAWRRADAPDRIGVSEMKHVDGLYRYWTDLKKAFPDMFIDNCTSGGRRLDYMLADFSFPLCQSDYPTYKEYDYSCVQLQNYYLNEVYPLHSTLSWTPAGDGYAIFSSACGLGVGSKIWQIPAYWNWEGFDFDRFRDYLNAILKIRSLLLRGNYYALTPLAEDLASYCAMQTHDAAQDAGYVMVFRREQTEESDFTALLHEIVPTTTYVVSEFETGETFEMSGKDFRRFYVTMDTPRSVRLFFYQKKA